MRHAVANGVDVDERVALLALEPNDWALVRCAVHALVGGELPLGELRLEVRERVEPSTGDGVFFTYFTRDSVLPFVRARYGCTLQSRQNAR